MYVSAVNSVRGRPENTLHQEVSYEVKWRGLGIDLYFQHEARTLYCIHHAANWIQTLAVIDCSMRQADMQ